MKLLILFSVLIFSSKGFELKCDSTWHKFHSFDDLSRNGIRYNEEADSFVGRIDSQNGFVPGRIEASSSGASSVKFLYSSQTSDLNFEYLKRNENFSYSWENFDTDKTPVTVGSWMIGRTTSSDDSYRFGKVKVGTSDFYFEDESTVFRGDYEILTCINKCHDVIEENVKLKDDVKKLEKVIKEISDGKIKSEQTVKNLEQVVKNTTAINHELTSDKKMLHERVQDLESSNKNLTENFAIKEKNLIESINDLTLKNTALEQKINNFEKRVKAFEFVETELENLKIQKAEQKGTFENQKREFERIQKELNEKISEKDQMIENLKQNLTRSDEEFQKIKGELSKNLETNLAKVNDSNCKFDFESHIITNFEGERLEIECPLNDSPNVTYSWMKNYLKLDDQSLTLKERGRKLMAEKSTERHSGNYSCIAESKKGSKVAHIEVIINTKPRFSKSNESNIEVTVMRGSSAVLECWAEGTPKPSIHWKRKGIGKRIAEKFLNLKTDENILIIPNVVENQIIVCFANNSYGTVQKTFTLTPVYAPTFDTAGIERVVFVTEGESFELECNLNASPIENIAWTKNSHEIKARSDSEFTFFTRNRVLNVNLAGMEHNGNFTCTASNEYGQISRKFRVKVNPKVEYTPWSEWSECDGECDSNVTQYRTRRCLFNNPGKGVMTCPDDTFQLRVCSCWSEWSDWMLSECPQCKTHQSVVVFQGRTRYCKEKDASKCVGSTYERRECNISVCEENRLGKWTEWSPWRPYQMKKCPKCYKSGSKIPLEYRYRSCKSKDWNGCEGVTTEYRNCLGIRVCSYDNQWSEWGDWTPCSKTCGTGARRRYRTCNLGKKKCSGKEVENEPCEIEKCERW